jgi:hypothetical protein
MAFIAPGPVDDRVASQPGNRQPDNRADRAALASLNFTFFASGYPQQRALKKCA